MMLVTLRRFLAFENDFVFSPIIPRIPGVGEVKKNRRARRIKITANLPKPQYCQDKEGHSPLWPFNQFVKFVFLTWISDQSCSSEYTVVSVI
jgi:hypothetical protein